MALYGDSPARTGFAGDRRFARRRAGSLARPAGVCSPERMAKSSFPGHLIAVLVLLVFVAPGALAVSATALPIPLGVVGLPTVMAWLVVLGIYAAMVWPFVLGVLLLLRTRRALLWGRITAGVMCAGGVVATVEMVVTGLGGVGLFPLLSGGYILWALGRADVRAWFGQVSAPAQAGGA